jgi:hypothetical protein
MVHLSPLLPGCPQQAWNPAGRAFRVAVQSFFRSPFPRGRTLGKRTEAWDTRRLCALRPGFHVEDNQTQEPKMTDTDSNNVVTRRIVEITDEDETLIIDFLEITEDRRFA